MVADCVVGTGWPSFGSFSVKLEFIGLSAYCGDREGRGGRFGIERAGSDKDIAENPVSTGGVTP